jgi:MFS family permease
VLAGATVQALLWLPVLLVPVLFENYAIAALVVLLALYHSANHFSAPQWTSLMRDLVSDRRRGRYFGLRTRMTTITTFVALIAGGLILNEFAEQGRTYLGFVIIFAVALVARLISVYHLSFLHEPSSHTAPADVHLEHWWDSLLSTGAVRCSAYFALMTAAVGISAPFFTVYMLRDMGLSYFEFMLLTGTSVFTQFLSLTTWGRIADSYGNRLILLLTSVLLPIVPMLWLVSDAFWYLLLAQALSGVSWSGFSLGAGNLLYDLVPRTRRAAYVAAHNVASAAGVFGGAMLGAALIAVLPSRSVLLGESDTASNLLYLFLLSGMLRAVIAALLARRVREIRKPRRAMSAPALVMRVTGFSAMLVLLYDFIGRQPPEDAEKETTAAPTSPDSLQG